MQYFYTCDHELSLNGLWLHGAGVDLGDFPYRFNIAGDSLDFGSHEALLDVVRNLWSDGSEAAGFGADNAETSFSVMIEGEDLTALAQGEAALRRAFPEPGQYADLVWRAGDGSPASIRTVVAAQMQFVSEGVENEARELQRIFEVTVTHKPFVRSEHETVVDALPVAPVPVDIAVDTFTSAAGWSFSLSRASTPSVGVSGGGLQAAATLTGGVTRNQFDWRLTRAGEITYNPAAPYLVISHTLTGAGVTNHGARISATYLPPGLPPDRAVPLTYAGSGSLGGVWRYTVFLLTGSIPNITFYGRTSHAGQVATTGVNVGRLRLTDNPNIGSSRRALMRRITVGGTERTTGALQVSAPNGMTALGTTVIHTSPEHCPGFDPDLLPDRDSAVDPTLDPTAPGGGWVRFDETSLRIKRDIAMVCKGSYAFVGYIKAATTATVTLTLSTVSVPPGGSFDVEQLGGYLTKTVSLTAGIPKMVILGVSEWLSIDAGSGDAYVILSDGTTTGVTLQVGGFWAFPLGDDSSLTIVDCNDPHLWVRSGLPGRNARVRINSVESEDAGYNPGPAKILAGPDLKYSAGETLTYVVTTGVNDAEVSYRFHKKWQAHAADDGSLP